MKISLSSFLSKKLLFEELKKIRMAPQIEMKLVQGEYASLIYIFRITKKRRWLPNSTEKLARISIDYKKVTIYKKLPDELCGFIRNRLDSYLKGFEIILDVPVEDLKGIEEKLRADGKPNKKYPKKNTKELL